MGKVVSVPQAIKIIKKKEDHQTIVLVGGCFDLLHLGHIKFLNAAKKQADLLMVMLESDTRVAKLKGQGRPINPQIIRAKMLAALAMVDYVVILPQYGSDQDYDQLIEKIKPDIIATTKPDPQIVHKKRVASLVGAKLKFVTARVAQSSTTKLIEVVKNG